jgi:hypothetical protein
LGHRLTSLASSQRRSGGGIRAAAIVGLLACFSQSVALTGCSGCSRPPVVPAALGRSAGDDACGPIDDGLAHIPQSFNDFAPPARGSGYNDPQYHCTIVRLTDAKRQFHVAVHHQYSTISPINQDDTRIMLITESGQGVIVDMSGNVVVGPNDFPGINAANVPWARSAPNVFYYTNGNTLYSGLVSGRAVKSRVLHTFAGYPRVVIPDEEDLSEDGDHLWIVAGTQAFLYTISTDSTSPGLNIGDKDAGCGWHKIQITPSNKMLITWACNGAADGRGQEVYSSDGSLYWHMFNNSLHTDVGRDLSGKEIAIVARIPDTYQDACPGREGADTIQLDPPRAISCLIDLNGTPSHISYRDSARGWVAISLFDQGTCPDYSCFSPGLVADWPSVWRHFYEEIILVKIDGSAVFRLAHHRSRSAEYYWAQSRAAISRDGGYVVFDSNMGISDSGLNSYSDVYIIKVR